MFLNPRSLYAQMSHADVCDYARSLRYTLLYLISPQTFLFYVPVCNKWQAFAILQQKVPDNHTELFKMMFVYGIILHSLKQFCLRR